MLARLRRYLRHDKGVTSIEFAMVAMPLFLIVFAIIELSMFFASGNVLEGASQEAGRRIRTGQVQAMEDPAQAFKDELCDNVGSMLNCPDIQYEVIRVADDTFASAQSMEPQFDENGDLVQQGFDAGNSSDVILIRSYYKWDFLTPFLGEILTGMPGGGWLGHLSTVVLRTEPYCTSIIQTNC